MKEKLEPKEGNTIQKPNSDDFNKGLSPHSPPPKPQKPEPLPTEPSPKPKK